ncbi:MAG: Ku protein [Planctomycetes bacterium]|nr:Ku protein [Planctomycetota bacterium]
MTARAMWRASLRLGDAAVPVKLYSAVQDRRVHFHLLHAKDLAPVKQRMVHPDTGAPVAPEDVRRGVEVERGVFVVVEPDELKALEPPASREVEVLRFVPRGLLRSQWYDRPYWLGPDGDDDAYFALAHELERRGREGIVRFTLRKRARAGALGAARGRLTLTTLRAAEEVLGLEAPPAPRGRALDDREVGLAEQLVEALADRFDPAAFRDEHRERLEALLEQKARGEAVRLERPRERRPSRSLAKALQASLRRAGKVA